MKKIFISAAVVAAAVFGVYTANQNNAMAQMSDLQMENIEALGQDGEPTNGGTQTESSSYREKVGPIGTNWAEYEYFCGYEIGTYCGYGPGLCIWDYPC